MFGYEYKELETKGERIKGGRGGFIGDKKGGREGEEEKRGGMGRR